MNRPLVLTAAAVAAATLTATAQAHLPGATFCSARQPAKVELRCATRDRWHALTTLRWLDHHRAAGSVLREAHGRGRLADSRVVYAATPLRRRIVRDHRWLYRESVRRIREARARLVPPWPPHHGLWLCIHGREGAWHDRDSGGNGHYGGLQMHPGWGYGTAYYASDSSQLVQEWAAERGYRASGYSRSWLAGQWGQTIGPCWGFA